MKSAHECAIAALPFLRTPFNYDRNAASRESGLAMSLPTRAQQQFKEECDINTIVRRFGLTGELPNDVRMPVEGDFSQVTDFQTALNLILEAEAGFMELPSNVRDRFQNDPAQLVRFVSDPTNLEEARRLGIARPGPTPTEPVIVRLAPDPDPNQAPPAPSSKGASAPAKAQ